MSDDVMQNLKTQMIATFGPTIGGSDLYAALGFKTYSAFYRSYKRNEIGVPVFTLNGRRGWFALTEEVAEWLARNRSNSSSIK